MKRDVVIVGIFMIVAFAIVVIPGFTGYISGDSTQEGILSVGDLKCMESCFDFNCEGGSKECLDLSNERCVEQCDLSVNLCVEECVLRECGESDYDCQNLNKAKCESECS